MTAMVKVLACAAVGAIVGGVLLFVVSQIGEDAVVFYPIHQAGTLGKQDAINYGAIVTRFALIMGVCAGAIVGAIAGLADNAARRPAA